MKRTAEELMRLGEPDPDFEKEVRLKPLPLPAENFFETRANRAAHLRALRKHYPIPGPLRGVVEEDKTIPVSDGAEITVRIYSPEHHAPQGGSALIVMYHEGGWCMGDLTDEDLNCRMLCRDLGAVCVNVQYRLAPENPFPTWINDSWDALKWAAANATSLKANPQRGFIVGGTSAGGNITAVLTHLARDEKLSPPLTGQYLCVPALLPPDVVPEEYQSEYLSFHNNTKDPVLKPEMIGSIRSIIGGDTSNWLISPFNYPGLHPHIDLPRAYFQICGMDPLRDEGLIYERVLREVYRIATRLDVYAGHGHMFWTNFPQLAASSSFVADTLKGFEWLLNDVAEKSDLSVNNSEKPN